MFGFGRKNKSSVDKTATSDGDAAEFTCVAVTGGVPHSPGYPTYAMVTRLVASIFQDNPAYALNLLSALCGGLAAGMLFVLARRVLTMPAALLAVGVWAFSRDVWAQSITAEVYAMTCLSIFMILELGLTAVERRSFLPGLADV